jgi:hypothetical protein
MHRRPGSSPSVRCSTGRRLKDIVIALQVTPEEVFRLYRLWQCSLDDPPPTLDLAAPASSTKSPAPTTPSRARWPKPLVSPPHQPANPRSEVHHEPTRSDRIRRAPLRCDPRRELLTDVIPRLQERGSRRASRCEACPASPSSRSCGSSARLTSGRRRPRKASTLIPANLRRRPRRPSTRLRLACRNRLWLAQHHRWTRRRKPAPDHRAPNVIAMAEGATAANATDTVNRVGCFLHSYPAPSAQSLLEYVPRRRCCNGVRHQDQAQ